MNELKKARKELGLSIHDLVEILGKSRDSISCYETGGRPIPPGAVEKVRRLGHKYQVASRTEVKRQRIIKAAKWAIQCGCPMEMWAWHERFGQGAEKILKEEGLTAAWEVVYGCRD